MIRYHNKNLFRVTEKDDPGSWRSFRSLHAGLRAHLPTQMVTIIVQT